MEISELVYLTGYCVATLIRSYYGMQFKRKEIAVSQHDNPIVYAGIAIWAVVLILPFFSIFTDWLVFANYEIPSSLRTLGAIIFFFSLLVLWRSHLDLARNFSPGLFIRNKHTLITTGIYRYIRHPMYLSFMLWSTGQALLIDNWLSGPLGLLAFALIYLFRVKREEQQLVERFGDEYELYQNKTGRVLPKLIKKISASP